MPDQPDDPIHYEMKIPPEPKDATLNKQEQQRGSDEAADESNKAEQERGNADNPARPEERSKP